MLSRGVLNGAAIGSHKINGGRRVHRCGAIVAASLTAGAMPVVRSGSQILSSILMQTGSVASHRRFALTHYEGRISHGATATCRRYGIGKARIETLSKSRPMRRAFARAGGSITATSPAALSYYFLRRTEPARRRFISATPRYRAAADQRRFVVPADTRRVLVPAKGGAH